MDEGAERELRREIADILPPCSLEWFDALMYRMHHAEEALAAKADGQSPEE
jgi:hypothetical protein